MTHKDIYTKFMIEYDKANVTSSYPSLTEYEVATVLDKAYNALIAQKVTGNNIRRSTFESDIKAIADLAPLTITKTVNLTDASNIAPNVVSADVPDKMLYFLQANMKYDVSDANHEDGFKKYENQEIKPFDNKGVRKLPVKLVNHEVALKFFSSAFNMPWIKEPVCYIESNRIYVVYDPLDTPLLKPILKDEEKSFRELLDQLKNIQSLLIPDPIAQKVTGNNIRRSTFKSDIKTIADLAPILTQDKTEVVNGELDVVYIKTPQRFVKDLDEIEKKIKDDGIIKYTDTYFDVNFEDSQSLTRDDIIKEYYTFECNDTVAEELISLAIAFALENIESSRLNAKLNMRGLEA